MSLVLSKTIINFWRKGGALFQKELLGEEKKKDILSFSPGVWHYCNGGSHSNSLESKTVFYMRNWCGKEIEIEKRKKKDKFN